MGKSILITGGARSGKSALAERMTLQLGTPAIYVATAEAHDEEMARRIVTHRARRGPEWATHAEPIELAQVLSATDGQGPRLVDCLTLWLSNLMLGDHDWVIAADHLTGTIKSQSSPVIFVTNEVGAGIVPENKLAREFRDAAGRLNQAVADVSNELWLCVAGHPLKVK